MSWKKFFKLPSPVELGMSKVNALALTKAQGNPNWEDWDAKVKKLHPIKYFVLRTVYMWIRVKIIRPLSDFWYFFKSKTFSKQHFLDLRQPKNEFQTDEYRYGYCDIPEKMLFAWFNLLDDYLNKEKPWDPITSYTLQQINIDPVLQEQYNHLQEAKSILNWWKVERKDYFKGINEIISLVQQKDNKLSEIEKEDLLTFYYNLETFMNEKEDEMLARIIKIRKSLWT